jgi:hypothetical protein
MVYNFEIEFQERENVEAIKKEVEEYYIPEV